MAVKILTQSYFCYHKSKNCLLERLTLCSKVYINLYNYSVKYFCGSVKFTKDP